jgi:glycosyltransferase involved in cell wall biosynthesis
MRVLFLASYFPKPGIPLAGVWALEQAKALAEVVDLEVASCTPWVPGLLEWIDKARPWINVPATHQWDRVTVRYFKSLYYPVAPLNAWAYPDPSRQMALTWASVRGRMLRMVERFRPHVLFCHHTAVSGYLASRIHAITGLPYVITDHDYDEIATCVRLPGRRAFFEPILRQACRHLSVSSRMEADVRRIFPFVATETLHNGVNLPTSGALAVPRPSELGNRLVIFSAGMFMERKGIPVLIEAFARVSDRYPEAILRIAGDGRNRSAIEEVIDRHRLRDRVFLLGRLPHLDILREMAWADFFALVGWDEPFGVVYLEAMSTGKPIVASTDSGIADIAQDGVHGLLVPPKDVDATARALDRLLGSPAERLEMGKNAEALVRDRLTWRANTDRLLQIFQLCQTGRSA